MRGRLHTALFVAVCLIGAATAVALAVHEAARTAPVVMSVTDKARAADTTTVTVAVRNTTGTSRCVAVRVAARDRAGHDLAVVTAARALALPPHARRTVTAPLTLTSRQYAEQLAAFYPSQHPCGGSESAG